MYLLKKVFQLRQHADDDSEKPFLEHLEDLRITLSRMTAVLLIATVTCFVFRNQLMEIIRRPVEEVWQASQKESLKDLEVKVASETWELAKKAARDLPALTDAQRDYYLGQLDGDSRELRFHAESVIYLRTSHTIPDESKSQKLRKKFIEDFPDIDDRMRKQVLALLDSGATTTIDARGKLVLMQALNPTEGFMLSIKLAFFAGIVISFPFLLYFLLQFILPGLHTNERRALFPAMAVGFGLFLTGVFFSYFYVLPRVLEFFYEYSQGMGIENEWRIGYYISFATQFTLIFGLSFELPVVVMTLVKLGILNYDTMKKTRSYAILAIFVIAAIITPTPDAFTLILLAGPMIVLYEICIWLAYFINKKEREEEEREEKERMERLLAAGPAPDPKPASDTVATDEDHDHDEHHGSEDEYGEHNDYDDHHEHWEYGDDEHPETFAEDDGNESEAGFTDGINDDPATTEEGEEEDISDPWPEDGQDQEDDQDSPQDKDDKDDKDK
jgi:sec-independent protein translocase protein TatC